MILNCGISQFTFRTESFPQAWIVRILDVFSTRAQGWREARRQTAILLPLITGLAILSTPCAAGDGASNSLPTVYLSAKSLSFGYVTVGITSAARTITLRNASSAALTIASITITGTNAGDFAQSNNCGSSVAIGAGCAINVTMAPSGAGMRRATLTISDSVGNGQSVSLAGIGVTPSIILSPSSLSFGSRATGTTSAAQTIYVNNLGAGTLIIANIAITGVDAADYGQTNNCGSSVAPQRTCTIAVTFTPIASGSLTASVTVADNVSGGTQTVALSGTATGSPSGPSGSGNPTPGVSLFPASLSFGSQPIATTSGAQTITLTNGNNSTLSINGLVIAGTNPGDFAEIANTCGTSVAAGGACTVEATFTPTGAGQRIATISISDNASNSPQAASFTGTGSPDIILSWNASPTPGIVGYNIYRGTASGGENPTPVNSTPINSTMYVDSNVKAGTTYYYVLTSVGSGGEQSPRSNETEAKVPTS